MLPFEFAVEGTPVSSNLRKKNASRYQGWLQYVRQSAFDSVSDSPLPTTNPVAVEILYFHVGNRTIDVDNLIKPVLDALEGVVYHDDRQVVDVTCRRRELHPRYQTGNRSPILVEKLAGKTAFVYVRIEAVTNMEDLGDG